MVITNYCRQVAKYYFLLHLLLGVFVAGFVFPSHALFLPNPTLEQTINIVTINAIAKASKHVLLPIRVSQNEAHFLAKLPFIDRLLNTRHDVPPSQPHKLTPPFLVVNTIRAGPQFIV